MLFQIFRTETRKYSQCEENSFVRGIVLKRVLWLIRNYFIRKTGVYFSNLFSFRVLIRKRNRFCGPLIGEPSEAFSSSHSSRKDLRAARWISSCAFWLQRVLGRRDFPILDVFVRLSGSMFLSVTPSQIMMIPRWFQLRYRSKLWNTKLLFHFNLRSFNSIASVLKRHLQKL